MAQTHVVNQRIADRLLADGRIAAAEHRQAIDHAVRNGARIEDALIGLSIMKEADLLKYIATAHKTRFVSTEKLSRAVIDHRLLSRVSRKTAELHGVFPVLFDEQTMKLSVVTADPDNGAALDEVKFAAGVRDVRALVARPAAVRAAIARNYHGDTNAFVALSRPLVVVPDLSLVAPFEKTLGIEDPPPHAQSHPPEPPMDISSVTAEPFLAMGSYSGPMPTSVPNPGQGSFAGHLPTAGTPAPMAVTAPPPSIPLAARVAPTETAEFSEALNILVTLLENSRPGLRGHSSRVGRLARKVCDRMGLPAAQKAAIVVGSYLHDLGKVGTYHLTALNVAEYEGHQINAKKAFEMPARLTESVRLPAEAVATMSSMYERYDGKGFPAGLAGKEIQLGARILAVVDTFCDITQNPRNPFRKALRHNEACTELVKHRGTVFDPHVVDILVQLMSGEDIRARLFSDRHMVLVVDPDHEETSVLELRLFEQGFEVKIARTAVQARKELESGEIDVVVTELDLEEPEGGLGLRQWAGKNARSRQMVWVVFTNKIDRASAQRAFELGVDDFVSKPTGAEVLVEKVRQLIERKSSPPPQGAGGSLDEMSLPDVVQVLWHGRKTCNLRVQSGSRAGEIHFHEGHVINALWPGLQGEDAFCQMLAIREGQFRIDLAFTPGPRVISMTPETLLLEAMRRMDEGTLQPM